jgi:hypothetical protein
VAVNTLVQFVQGATTGTPGQALIGATGTAVTVQNGGTNPSPDPGTWTFTVLGVPSASAVPTGVVQTGSTQTWSFTPDVRGTYVVQLQVTDNTTGATSTDVRAFGVYTSLGAPYLIPSFTGNAQSLNFGGQLAGWDVHMEAWLNLLLAIATGTTPIPIPAPTIVSVVTSGARSVATSTHYYVNLGTAGGNVTINTSSLVAGNSFKVKIIGTTTGGFSVTINPITAGSHIESRTSPGTLTTTLVMNTLGDEVTLESPDGANLYF